MDLILHRALKIPDRPDDGPMRILAAVEMPLDVDAVTLSVGEGRALAIVLLHYLPRRTIDTLIDTLLHDVTALDQTLTEDG